ncbi:TraR/DksA C4-type zinc finger protein [Streptomyces sp. NBC_01298]|uniref:TraR/DksA family transcriptional regulator n=1 Tax=Streptomyces sp. NBC_01298 TaxID=2903817 RepID=UPI002E163913|nr:TraR/DksA C4-type zinc finger protein [Streptomyces sp. NBC_01298]
MVAKKTAGSTAKKAVGKAAEEPAQEPVTEVTAPDPEAGPVEGAAAGKKAAATKKAATKKTVAKTTVVKKTAATKTAATKTAAKKAAAKTAGAEGAAQAAHETGARKVVAKKSTGTARKTATAATSGLPKARGTAGLAPGELAVRPGEDPWTPDEVADARAELESEVLRLRAELQASDAAISGLMRDSGDGAGDDQADTGTKNITRESELALAANANSMLEQTERALERLESGTYGLCENCGQPIGKARMQAFPRATLCVDCKQKQERRH